MRNRPKKNKKDSKRILVTLIFSFVALVLLGLVLWRVYVILGNKVDSGINNNVVVETGSTLNQSIFISNDFDWDVTLLTDISQIDTTVVGTYRIKLKSFIYNEESILEVRDSTGPSGEAIPQSIYSVFVPDASDVVTTLYDYSMPVSVYYTNEEMTFPSTGVYYVPVSLEDYYGNVSVIDVPFDVICDEESPIINGIEPLSFFIGDPIRYMDNITVTDDYATSPSITVDTSEVNISEEGEYNIYYIATDDVGNETISETTITLEIKPEGYVEEEVVYELASDILYNTILEEDVEYTELEIAFRIITWVRYNVGYMSVPNHTCWTGSAYNALRTRTGDCYSLFAASKALLDVAGIENMMVERYPISWGPHYWNLVKIDGEWYHCDATTFSNRQEILFMCIDDEMPYMNCFDPSLYPPRATESVQRRLDFYNMTIRDEE